VAWPGYIERGETDKSYDWVTGFEKDTGCKVSVKTAATSDEMVALMNEGGFDLVTASGDASLRLVAGNRVQEINTALIPSWSKIDPRLQNAAWHTVNGKHYGVPYQWGPNVLAYNTEVFKGQAPDSWKVVFEEMTLPDGKSNKDRVQAYDGPIYIADAALYLMAHQPDLGITNPYELDEEQFNAAIDLLKQQREFIGEYWSDYAKQIQSFANGDTTVGTTWPYQYLALQAEGDPVKTTIPEEGSTGWSDTWMISSEAQHPNCMYMWMNHITEPQVQADVAEWFGEAPANSKACEPQYLKKGPFPDVKHCEKYDASGEKYLDDLYYWTTPVSDCGDDRGDVCKTYDDWVQGWTEVKG
jgi:putative spermidine/putrescine transport system substrate-binding protein